MMIAYKEKYVKNELDKYFVIFSLHSFSRRHYGNNKLSLNTMINIIFKNKFKQ